MSMTLVLWKSPVVFGPDEAEQLLEPYYEIRDESTFAPSADLTRMSDDLFLRYQDDDADERPWANSPLVSDRVITLHIRWEADDAVLDTILDLAREQELVFYDPQGPDIHCPPWDPDDVDRELPPPSLGEYGRIVAIGAVGVLLVVGGWVASVPVLSWIAIALGVFVSVLAIVFLAVSVRHSLFGVPPA